MWQSDLMVDFATAIGRQSRRFKAAELMEGRTYATSQVDRWKLENEWQPCGAGRA